MAAEEIVERDPKLQTGPIRVTLPAAVAYDPDRLKRSLGGILEQIGCRACCSGADIFLTMEREFVVDRNLKISSGRVEGDPDTNPSRSHKYTVGLSPGVKYDIDRVFESIDKVIDILGHHPCISGFDILLRDELRTIVVNERLEAQRFDQPF